MNEASFFEAGMLVGYLLTVALAVYGAWLVAEWRKQQLEKFLRERKLLQSFADWREAKRFKFKFKWRRD